MNFKNMAGIYIFYDNNVLMMKRTKNDFNGYGEYYSIGGKFEEDELNNPVKCVLRELEEETGLTSNDIDDLYLKYIVFRNHNGVITQNHLFFANLINKKELKECNEGIFEWIPIKEIFNMPLPASSKACLKHFFDEGMKSKDITIAVATNKDGLGEYQFTELLPFDTLK